MGSGLNGTDFRPNSVLGRCFPRLYSGLYAAGMPHPSLHGRVYGVSRIMARAALHLLYLDRSECGVFQKLRRCKSGG